MYIQAVDNRWYLSPQLYTNDYLITVSPIDINLYIKSRKNIRALLNGNGIYYKIISKWTRYHTAMPPKWKLFNVHACTIEFTRPIPVPQQSETSVTDDCLSVYGMMYGWKHEFDTKDIEAVLNGDPLPDMLRKFLVPNEDEVIRKIMKSKLKSQLRGINLKEVKSLVLERK